MEMENFVFLREGNKVMAGGYEIDNKFMREGMPAISNIKKGGGSLDTLAVPAGLFLLTCYGWTKSIHPHTGRRQCHS